MTSIHEALAVFGSQRALARALGTGVTNVWNWKEAGRVPHWRQAALEAAVNQRRRDLAHVPKRRRRG